jgi:trehalose/maltose hydrolase-like predicted phosphorylase
MTTSVTSKHDPWVLSYNEWSAHEQPLRESICTLGNGYFATRGAAEETTAGGPNYPGTYVAGGYNRLESEVAGRTIENEDLVNWPNWLCLSFRAEGDDWFHVDSVDLLEFQQQLDLRQGILERRVRFRHGADRETTLVSRRLVHMGQPHLAAIQWELTPHNWSGPIEIRSALDGTVTNQGVERYRGLSSRHLEVIGTDRVGEDGICLTVQTNHSFIRMVQAARTQAFVEDEHASPERRTTEEQEIVEQRLVVECARGKPLRVEKVVALFTSRDFAISEPATAARDAVTRAGTFSELCRTHVVAWKRLWNRADIEIHGGNGQSQLVLRLHVFHLLQTTSFNSVDLDAGVPARGLHGEAYRGHIFWDELFIFPFLNLRVPELTRSLLMYRYRRLPAARRLAQESGNRGAMFPWQSGASGREESQMIHLNPRSGRWIPDNTFCQRHVNAAIAYNVWQYFQVSGDIEFLSFHGAEMLLEIARFWASVATYNVQRDRYEIHDVVGPDEFHTQYHDSDTPGLKNNAYTNITAAWSLHRALCALDWLAEDRRAELVEQLAIGDEELRQWDAISRRMYVPFHDDGIISQFEGYEDLKELAWDRYRDKYGDIQRLDRILEAEGDSPNRYKASKQADVLMLFYLFSSEELAALFERLGYAFDPGIIPRSVDYYIARTSDGSTLSRVVHAWVLARSDRERAWQLFGRALQSDIGDIQGGTTSEGIHLGAMAGTVDLIQRCHTGIEMRDEILWFNPCLPKELVEVRLRIQYRGHWLRVRVAQQQLAITFEHGWSGPARIGVGGQVYEFAEGDERVFPLQDSPRSS